MGYARKRIGQNGKPRYTAYYLDIRGKERSAGTFSNTKDARDAWKEAEGQVRAGKQGDPAVAGRRSRATCRTSGCPTTSSSRGFAETTRARSASTYCPSSAR